MKSEFFVHIDNQFNYPTGAVKCGWFSMLALAHAELADAKRRRRTLHRPWSRLEMYGGLALPSSMAVVLRANGFVASVKRVELEKKQLAAFIRGKVEEQKLPLILFVGLPLKIPFRGVRHCIPHWLTVWGYSRNGEAGESGFYVYCSDVNVRRCHVPAGNTFMTDGELIEKWTGLDYTKWWRRLYIDVSDVRENIAA